MGDKNNTLACERSLEDVIDFDFYKTLFDPVRSEILIYLASHGEKNITEIADNFSQDRSVISRHLDLLFRYGMVRKTKVNRSQIYEINSQYIISKFENTTENMKHLMHVAKSNEMDETTQLSKNKRD